MDEMNPITMPKTTLQEFVYLKIAMIDEGTDAWRDLNAILLTMLGVIDSAGSLSPDYATSPMWTLTDDNVLMPSVVADAASLMFGDDLSEDHVVQVLTDMAVDPDQAKAMHGWMAELGAKVQA